MLIIFIQPRKLTTMGIILSHTKPVQMSYMYSRTYENYIPGSNCDRIRVDLTKMSESQLIARLRKSSNKQTAKWRTRIARYIMAANKMPDVGYYLFAETPHAKPFLKVENTNVDEIFDQLGQKWMFIRFTIC